MKQLNLGFIHLDLWAGNILVTEDLSHQWLIDLEHLKFEPKRSIERQLGFCLGYFYEHKLYNYTSIEDYLDLVKSWLTDIKSTLDHKKLLEITHYFSKKKMNRKKRFKYF